MKKETYLLITILLFVSFFDFALFSSLSQYRVKFAVYLVWYVVGILLYPKRNVGYSYTAEKKSLFFIMLGLFLTLGVMVVEDPYPNFNSYLRYILIIEYYFAIPVLLYVSPSKTEILNATWKFSLIYIVAFIVRVIEPEWFAHAIDETTGMAIEIAEGDFGFALQGCSILLIPLYYYLAEIKHGAASRKIITRIVILTIMVFLNQNRSTLFPMALIFAMAMWSSKKAWLRIVILIAVVLVFINPIFNPLANLLEETAEQTSNTEYGRVMGWTYLPTYNCDTWVHALFGHGYGPKSLDQLENLKLTTRIDTSDVGYIGFWTRCGLIPLISMTIVLISSLLNKKYPVGLKYFALTIIICSATLSYFLLPPHIIWFFLFFLLWSDARQSDYLSGKIRNYTEVHKNQNKSEVVS